MSGSNAVGLDKSAVAYLRYFRGRPVLRGIRVVSRGGHRRYFRTKEVLRRARKNTSVFLVLSSTSGVNGFSGSQLNYFKYRPAGEILAECW